MNKKEILTTISIIYESINALKEATIENSTDYDDEMLGDLQVVRNELDDVVVMVKILREKKHD